MQWQVRMRFTLRAWLKDCLDREAVFERVLLVSSLEPDTERWTRNLRPKTSIEAGEIATLFQRTNQHLRPGAYPPPTYSTFPSQPTPTPQREKDGRWTKLQPNTRMGSHQGSKVF